LNRAAKQLKQVYWDLTLIIFVLKLLPKFLRFSTIRAAKAVPNQRTCSRSSERANKRFFTMLLAANLTFFLPN
jgi:hypothetical protein